jgi:hypothetical protein
VGAGSRPRPAAAMPPAGEFWVTREMPGASPTPPKQAWLRHNVAQRVPVYGPQTDETVPRRMLSLVMTGVNRMANLPVAQRPPRIAVLEWELDELHRVEELLVVPQSRPGNPCTARPQRRPRRCWGSGCRIRSRVPPDQQRDGQAPPGERARQAGWG